MSRALHSFSILLIPLLLLSACAIQPIQPEATAPTAEPVTEPVAAEAPPATAGMTDEEAAAVAVVEAFAEVARSHPMLPDNLDEYMAFYADDAEMWMLPVTVMAAKGKPAIRSYLMAHDAKERLTWELEVLDVNGPAVTVHTFAYGTWTGQLQSGGLDGTELYVIADGLIAQHIWAPTPDSNVETYDLLATRYSNDLRLSELPSWFEAAATATAPWAEEAPGRDAVDASLAAYSDDIVFTIVGLPGGPQVYEGKDALRALMDRWVANGSRFEFTPIASEGLLVVGSARMWDAELDALGVAPLEATEIFNVERGLVTRAWWVITPDSLERLVAAQAAAPAPAATSQKGVDRDALTDEEKATLEAFEAYSSFSADHPMTPDNLSEFLAFYADDAVLTILGNPESLHVFSGKEAIREYYLGHDAEDSTLNTFEVLGVEGDRVTARATGNSEWWQSMNLLPIDATETYVLKDGLIREDTFVWAADSLEETVKGFAAIGWDVRAGEGSQGLVDVVKAATAPAALGTLNAEAIEESLQYYADDVILAILGMPGGPQVYEGKEALRGVMEQWAEKHTRVEFEPIMKIESEVTGRSLMWDDELEAMGIAPLEATEVFKIHDGLITHDTWSLSPDSYTALFAAMRGK